MLKRLVLSLILALPVGGLVAQQRETADEYYKVIGDVSVSCHVGNATGFGSCNISHRPELLFVMSTRFLGDSILLELFAIQRPWNSAAATIQIDSLPAHSSVGARPFGMSESRAIVQEIEHGHKARIDAPANDNGKLSHTTVDLSELRDGIHLAHGFIRGLAHRQGSPRSTGAPLVCADGVAPPGTDTLTHAYSGPETNTMMMPPFNPPKSVKGHTVKMNFLIGPTGGIDSVAITGITDVGYIQKMMKSAQGYHFFPATVDNCTMASWYHLEITIGN